MPILDYNLESTYANPYNYGLIGGYNRVNKETIWQGLRHSELLPQLNIQSGQTIVMVGVGFGWIAEKWIEQGLGPICAIDTSQWIQSAKTEHAILNIHDFDVTDHTSHDLIKQSLGIPSNTKVDWCITEDFFTEIFDQECLDIAASLRVLGNNIVHYISPKPSEQALQIPVINMRNWKTKEEWENFLSPDTIIMR